MAPLSAFGDDLPMDTITAHWFCSHHRAQVECSAICGCFYCLAVFPPSDIKSWVGQGGQTALCPRCGIDSVLGSGSGVPITHDFLLRMKQRWFEITHPWSEVVKTIGRRH
jgi:hypothetical protein